MSLGTDVKSIFAYCLIALLPSFANAQDASPPPKISEIMVQQQMRHIKLWFAGRAANWPLADYEIDALRDGFEDVNQQFGGDAVENAVGGPLSALDKAIEAKDRAAFTDAYDKLTAGCNSCHRSLGHAFIVIRRPTLLPYDDQSFAAQKIGAARVKAPRPGLRHSGGVFRSDKYVRCVGSQCRRSK